MVLASPFPDVEIPDLSVPAFVLAQLAGAGIGRALFRVVFPHPRPEESLS